MRLDQTLRFAEYGLLPVELRQSENCKLKSKNVRDNNEKSNILAAGHRNDDHSACRMILNRIFEQQI